MRSITTCLIMAAMLCAGSDLTAHAEPAEGVQASGTATTRLQVKTIPPGAQVTLDGKPLGPSDGLLLVPAGTAKVSVQFDGQAPQVQQVEIAVGQITRVEIQRGATDAAGLASPIPAIAPAPDWPPANAIGLKSSRKLESPPAPLTKFDDILEKPLDFEVHQSPLRDVARMIGQKAGLHISFDLKAFEDAGRDLDSPITASATGLSLACVLDIVCRPLDLAWIVEDDGFQITTADRAAETLFVHVHDVSDLCESDLTTLLDLIPQSIEPHTWNTVGGQGSIQPDISEAGTFLVVSHTLAAQRQIKGFLECLRRLKTTPPAEWAPIAAKGYWGVAEPAAQAREAFDKPIANVEFFKTPLREAVQQISAKACIPIAIDRRALDDAGIAIDTPVTIEGRSLSLAKLLAQVLAPSDLIIEVVDDRLTVTTRDTYETTMTTAIYPVHRLVGKGGKHRSFGSLMDLVVHTVEPTKWNVVGGAASVQPVPGDVPCLVIRQTTAGHRAVDAFLRSLR